MQVGSRCHLWMKSGGRDPLGFRSIFSGFGYFQIICFLENDPGGIKNSKISKKTSEIKYLELDLIFLQKISTKNIQK